MADDLIAKYANLQLNEEGAIVDLGAVESNQQTDKYHLMLIGKLITDRPYNVEAFKSTMTKEPVMPHENICSGRCKAIVGRIVEQVRAETEQWSQMQEMLAQVRGEMEELHASRDFWENRAFNADRQIQSLRQDVEEWKEKALGYESKVNELQLELSIHKDEIHKLKSELLPPVVPLQKQLEKEKLVSGSRSKKNRHIDIGGYKEFENALKELNIEEEERTPKEDLPPLSLGKQLAKEKRMLLRRLKRNRHDGIEKGSIHELSADGRRKISYSTGVGILDPKRSPLMDIGNSSPLTRQSSRSAFGFYSPENSRIKDSFKKMISLH